MTGLQKQRGLTLIELLVAVLILSIGMLGIAGLQLGALKSNTNAFYASQGIWLAYDMADRMRANNVGVRANAYNGLDVDGTETAVDCSSGCTPGVLATYDAYVWGQKIATLPEGQVMVTDNGDGTYDIAVMWDEAQGATGTGCDPANPDDKICARVTFRP